MQILEVRDVRATEESVVFVLEDGHELDERDTIGWDWKASVEEVVQDLYEAVEQDPSLLKREFVRLETHNDSYQYGWLPQNNG